MSSNARAVKNPDRTDYLLRLSPALKVKLKEAARENYRSVNAEICARLERSFREVRPL
jgi:hypothetical protein